VILVYHQVLQAKMGSFSYFCGKNMEKWGRQVLAISFLQPETQLGKKLRALSESIMKSEMI
jgi:hypothetical protein